MTTRTLTRVTCPFCEAEDGKHERSVNGFALERCRRCNFVYMNPQVADLDEFYTGKDADKLIDLYSRAVATSVIDCYNQTLSFLESLSPGRGRLLDFACAAGYFHEQALNRGWDAHGADLGEWTAKAAQARGLKNLHVGRLADLGFADHYFDVVHAAQVFEHLPHPKKDLAELIRILRPGGLLYVDVPNYRTLPIMSGMDDFMLNMPPQHINYFTPRTLRALLLSAGLKDVRILSSGGLKWENLIGKPIKSDILDAYTRPATPSKATRRVSKDGPTGLGGGVRWVRRKVVQSIAKPFLYNQLKVGMTLIGVARRP